MSTRNGWEREEKREREGKGERGKERKRYVGFVYVCEREEDSDKRFAKKKIIARKWPLLKGTKG